MSLYDLIYEFFETYIFVDGYGGILSNIYFEIGTQGTGVPFLIDGQSYLNTLASLISIIIIVVLCCLFVYKIIKLIGGLIR